MNQVSLELIREAQRVRARLRNPPNAKADEGIDLQRRPRLGFRYQGEVVEIASIEQMQEVIEQRIEPPAPIPLKIPRTVVNGRHIVRKVAAFYGRTYDELIGPHRYKDFVIPRQVAFYLLRAVLRKSYTEMGRILGGRDHTTALHGVKKIEKHLGENGALTSDIAHLEAELILEMEGAR